MIIMENSHRTNTNNNSSFLQIFGFGLVEFTKTNLGEKTDIIFQKGMGIPFIQNLLELYKKEIIEKKKGNSIVPLDEYTVIIHFFENKQGNILLIIFMDEKEKPTSYGKLYLISKKINERWQSNLPSLEIKRFCNEIIQVPRTDGILALLIIGATGSPYITKINKDKTFISNSEVQISGFISALFSFSKEIINQDSGATLKEINFGNQHFYMIVKNDVIFAYLVKKMKPLIKRYMYLIVEEFLSEYSDQVSQFDGDVTRFNNFENLIDEYFVI